MPTMQYNNLIPIQTSDDVQWRREYSLLEKVFINVLDQLTTQKLSTFYSNILEWILFQSNRFSNYIASNETDHDPKLAFYGLHPEAFWSVQVVVEIFCEYTIPELFRNDNVDEQYQNLIVRNTCTRITLRLFEQLRYLVDGLDPDFIICLSGEKYESSVAEELSIVLVPSEYTLPIQSRFCRSAQLNLCISNVHAIRKQLNMAQKGSLAICRNSKDNQFYTIGLLAEDLTYQYPRFLFNSHMEWQFCVPVASGETACRLRYHQGMLKLPLVDLTEEIQLMLRDVFGVNEADKIACIIRAVDKIEGGAGMIISSCKTISAESEHLAVECGRGIQFQKPVDVSLLASQENILQRLTSIDGAILVDENGFCHACGIIVDGEAEANEGNSGRGARYNCTKTYARSLHSKYPHSHILGVVKSEDGMLDLFLHSAKE